MSFPPALVWAGDCLARVESLLDPATPFSPTFSFLFVPYRSGCSSLTEFPSSIGALGRLHTLNISACRLLDPKTCLSLVNLGELDITGSAMETLTWVMFFPRLDVLHAKRLPDITHVAPELWATTQVRRRVGRGGVSMGLAWHRRRG